MAFLAELPDPDDCLFPQCLHDLNTFTPFLRLPKELRLDIWELIIRRPRTISVHVDGHFKPYTRRPNPALFFVNMESRKICKKLFTNMCAGNQLKRIYFQPDLDTIFFRRLECFENGRTLKVIAARKLACLDRIRHLKLEWTTVSPFCAMSRLCECNRWKRETGPLSPDVVDRVVFRHFPSLENLCLVALGDSRVLFSGKEEVDMWRKHVASNATELAKRVKTMLEEAGKKFKVPKVTVILPEKPRDKFSFDDTVYDAQQRSMALEDAAEDEDLFATTLSY